MAHHTLVDVSTLAAHLHDPRWVTIDCRFALADPEAGARKFAEGTIPGSGYAHLDRDLSGPVVAGRTGRHPLPSREAFASTVGGWGIGAGTQVVAFDDMGGAFAARLWWMLRWIGHEAVAVLDGGLPAWGAAGHALAPGVMPTGGGEAYAIGASLVDLVEAEQVLAGLGDPSVAVFDARAASRYAGEGETIDPIAGHIAGARSAPFMDNLGAEGCFLPTAELAERWRARLSGADAAQAIAYCGSGVTACHDVLAMQHAGLGTPRLYPGSWSEWITDPSRPRATGADPR